MGVINLMKGLFYGGNHMYYIGVDLGTSSLKLLLMDEKGKIQNIVSKEYNLYFPKEGWAEQNPQDWWRAFETGILELLEDYDAKEVEGISFGGQMHGLVILDDHDEVIRPAILWNDGRTKKQVAYLNEEIGKENLQIFMFDDEEYTSLALNPEHSENLVNGEKSGFNPFYKCI